MKIFAARLAVMASAATMLASGPAAAAVRTQTVAYSPWAALSAFAAPASSQALCGAAAASAVSSAMQAGTPGCVFPAVDAPVAASVAEAAPLGTPRPQSLVAAWASFRSSPGWLRLAELPLCCSATATARQISVSP